jgi:hypothetical protein
MGIIIFLIGIFLFVILLAFYVIKRIRTGVLDRMMNKRMRDSMPDKMMRDILFGNKTIWEPFELASKLGFDYDPSRFYRFITMLRGDTIRFHSGKILVDVDAGSGRKEDVIVRYSEFMKNY